MPSKSHETQCINTPGQMFAQDMLPDTKHHRFFQQKTLFSLTQFTQCCCINMRN